MSRLRCLSLDSLSKTAWSDTNSFIHSCFHSVYVELYCRPNMHGWTQPISGSPPASEMTYIVSSGALNSTHSLTPAARHQLVISV